MRFSGSIAGLVTDRAGAPQMGASVLLYNHQDRVCEKALTDQRGEFRFLRAVPRHVFRSRDAGRFRSRR